MQEKKLKNKTSNLNFMTSANALFHFTKSVETIISILSNGFYPHYCLEDYKILTSDNVKEEKFELAITMVCFCDIPLTQIQNHVSIYGDYGIGLLKNWGESKGISPLLYCNKNNMTLETIKSLMQQSEKNKGINGCQEMQILVNNLIPFIKPYEGEMLRNDKYKYVKFYDEKEWRYTLTQQQLKTINITPTLFKIEFQNEERLNTQHRKLTQYPLIFEASDVKYLIVKNENEKLELIERINSISRFGQNEKHLLYTKIISIEYLEQDF
jgi:hypothetical protein